MHRLFFALGETSFFTYDMIPWAKATIEHLHIPHTIYRLHTDMLSKHTNRNSKSMHGAIHLLRNLGSRSLSVNAVYILVGTYQSFNEIVHHLVFFFNPDSLPCRKTLRLREGLCRIEIYPESPPPIPRDHHIPRLRIPMKNPRKMNVLEYMTKFT